jgi:hypothetical protein
VSTILEIALATLSILPFAFVAYLFVWAAKKDSEEDRAFQRRLGMKCPHRLRSQRALRSSSGLNRWALMCEPEHLRRLLSSLRCDGCG